MRLSNLVMMSALAAGCGTGVESDPQLGQTPGGGSGSSMQGPSEGSGDDPCAVPEGPLHAYKTAEELSALILGKWRQCSGPVPPTFDANTRGLEFVADGTYHTLIDNGKGELVRAAGFPTEGMWGTRQINDLVLFDLHPTPSTVFGDPPRFEDDPRRFAFNPSHNGADSIYLWIGE
jgi:hypothetical protein